MKVAFLIIGSLLLVLVLLKRENYGQDASVRVSAGWPVGKGMYGVDPITEFAEQIESQRHHPRYPPQKERFQFGCDAGCPYRKMGTNDDCPVHKKYDPNDARYPSFTPDVMVNASNSCGC